MANPTNFEQEMLVLLNRARLDPQGEYDALIIDAATLTGVTDGVTNALRYFGVDPASFRAQLAGIDPIAPVAWNDALAMASAGHSQMMIDTDTQSHQLPGEPALGTRVSNAGYTNWSLVAENVFAYTLDPVYGHAGFYIDWGYDDADWNGSVLYSDWQTRGDGIQDAYGHRRTMLNAGLTEVGMSALAENDSGTEVGPFVVTQNFGNRFDYSAQLLGVVIRDADGDNFYDAGEGLGGVTVTVTGVPVAVTTTWASGGYQMELAPGTYEVVFSGGALTGTITREITMGSQNFKLDAEAADAVAAGRVITGDDRGNVLSGGAGPDTISGLGGNDWITPGTGSDTIDGGAGTDMASFIDHPARVVADLTEGTVRTGSDINQIRNVENITGTIHSDYLRGDAGANLLRGMGGYDWFVGTDGADTIDGSNGRDMISYINANGPVTVDLGQQRGLAGQAEGDIYISIERATGSAHPDLFLGSDGEDDFRGMGGYDWFVDSPGRDRYDGGSGLDTVSYSRATVAITASLAAGRGGPDFDLFNRIDSLTGSSQADRLTGNEGRNVLRGLYGEDTLIGNGGNDRLEGGASNDYLDGGANYDVALFSGNRRDYSVSTEGDITTVSHLDGGRDGTDTLINIETLIFADGLFYL